MRLSTLPLISVLCLAIPAFAAPPEPTSPLAAAVPAIPRVVKELAVSIDFRAEGYTLHEPIVATVTIRNVSSRPVKFLWGRNVMYSLSMRIHDPENREFKGLRIPAEGGSVQQAPITLAPDEVYRNALIIDELISLPEPGRYYGDWSINLDNDLAVNRESLLNGVASGYFQVVVSPRDEARLRLVARQLTDVVTGARTAGDKPLSPDYLKYPGTPVDWGYMHYTWGSGDFAKDTTKTLAATALSYLRDPVVLPFVDEIIAKSPEYALTVLTTLRRTGDEASVAALTRFAKHSARDIASSAAYELEILNGHGARMMVTD